MKTHLFTWLLLAYCGMSPSLIQAAHCPDPSQTSLQYGSIPEPWLLNPFSAQPRGEKNTHFIRANVLVAGFGRGIVCAYQNTFGTYSIWWPVNIKIPAPTDNNWHTTLGGYACTTSLAACSFYP